MTHHFSGIASRLPSHRLLLPTPLFPFAYQLIEQTPRGSPITLDRLHRDMSARCPDRFTSTEAADEIYLVLLPPPDRDRRSKNSIRQGMQSSLNYTEIFI
jgi:hypothetical protein